MGRLKKGFNWRARAQPSSQTVQSPSNKQLLDKTSFDQMSKDDDNDSNMLVVTDKRVVKRVREKERNVERKLSKKKLKHLQKVVDKKRKKAERTELLSKLQAVQVKETELQQMTSIAAVQTRGLKRSRKMEQMEQTEVSIMDENDINDNNAEEEDENNISKSKKRRLKKKGRNDKSLTKTNSNDGKSNAKQGDPNVLGFDESSSEDGDEETRNDVNDKEKEHIYKEKDNSDTHNVDLNESNSNETIKDNKGNSDSTEENREFSIRDTTVTEKSNQAGKEEGEKGRKRDEIGSNNDSTRCTKQKMVISPKPPEYLGNVAVNRSEAITESRSKLPIVSEEQLIVESIGYNHVVVICGQTGSGKTTQVPQFLYEAGYAKNKLIGVTEPRRVAAVAMARRVGEELNEPKLVGYQIRFEHNVNEENTRIKFMTDGILLREMANDFRLSRYSVIVVDEAHERSVFTDILLGNLSRIVPLRAKDEVNGPLKLVVMSATLRVEDFTNNAKLFKTPPPVVSVDSRQYETSCHFSRTTPQDYMSACFKKASQIHRKLPEGGILIFVTGQREVRQLVKKLRQSFSKMQSDDEENNANNETDDKISFKRKKKMKVMVPKVDLNSYRAVPLDDNDADVLSDDENEFNELDDDLEDDLDDEINDNLDLGDNNDTNEDRDSRQPMWVLPLYSMLSAEKQAQIFLPPPKGHRLCVISTNVAETSLTIPGIKYVVDSGKTKTKIFDPLTGVTSFVIENISKASAEQRAGRAGRVSSGHCYRLYSSAVYDDMNDYSKPEILLRPVDDLVLQMKAMGIVNVANFPFPTPPDRNQIKTAEQQLEALGALKASSTTTTTTGIKKQLVITELGRCMSYLPLAPRFAKMLALSSQFSEQDNQSIMAYTIAMIAALSVQEVLVEAQNENTGYDRKRIHQIRRLWSGQGNSRLLGDPMILLKAVGAAEMESHRLEAFCIEYGLRTKAMQEIRKLRRQISNEFNLALPDGHQVALDQNLKPPDDRQAFVLRQLVTAGMINNVAKRWDSQISQTEEEVKSSNSSTNEKKRMKLAYKCTNIDQPVFLHPKSVFAWSSSSDPPEWVVYQEIFSTDDQRLCMRNVTAIQPEWLHKFARSQCQIIPASIKESYYDSQNGRIMRPYKGTFGPCAWLLPPIALPMDTKHAYLFMARFILEGKVLKLNGNWLKMLMCRPASLTEPNFQYRGESVKAFVEALTVMGVESKERLAQIWSDNKSFLLEQFKALLPQVLHKQVERDWPPQFV